MSTVDLGNKIEELSDLELALLLSLTANEHCLIQTEGDALDALGLELQLITSNIFTRAPALIDCNAETTLDDFTNGLLVESWADEVLDDADVIEVPRGSQIARDTTNPGAALRPTHTGNSQGSRRIADVIILKNLDLADYELQIQALELIRSKRIYTNTNVFTARKGFCIVFVQDIAGPSLNKHLNDHIFMSHFHNLEDGFANLEAASEWIEDDRSSSLSVVRKSVVQKPKESIERTFSEADIQQIVRQVEDVTMTAEVKCYIQNIVTFLRVHRAVDGGMTPRATIFFNTLVKCLAPLHGLRYVTPSLVAIAARKIYPHRIVPTVPDRERSLQYGSDLEAVRAYLESVTPVSIVQDVLASVETPL